MRKNKYRCFDQREQAMFPVQLMRWNKISNELTDVWGVDIHHKDSDYYGDVSYGGSVRKRTVRPNETRQVLRYKIMQYTGLKDIDGKEIYEGDILKYKSQIPQHDDILTHEVIGLVVIDKGMTGLDETTRQVFKGEENIHKSKTLLFSPEIYKIIGNIYENDKLLGLY